MAKGRTWVLVPRRSRPMTRWSHVVARLRADLGPAAATRRDLGAEDVANIVRSEVAARQEDADAYEAAGHAALAAQLRAEADAVAAYLGPAV